MVKTFNTTKKSNTKELKLIKENYSEGFSAKGFKESEANGEKRWNLGGIGAQSNLKNGNGRIYPDKILTPAFEEYRTIIEQKMPGCLGEMSHPSGQDPNRSDSDINFDWVSHMIVEVKLDPTNRNNWLTKSKVLKNPIGLNYIVPILEEGVTLAFSTRGFGESMFSESEGAEIVTNYKLLTIDLVSRPSAPEAYQKGIYEGAKKFATIMKESKSNPKSVEARQVKSYYDTLELFKELGEEKNFVTIMEAYSWDYVSFYKDFSNLTIKLLKNK